MTPQEIEKMVIKKTNKYVYFSDNTHMSHSDFHHYKQSIRNEYAIIHQKDYAQSVLSTVVKTKDLVLNKPKVNSNRPVNALRYVIMINYTTEEYKWVFANASTSHSEIEQEFQNEYGNQWDARAGGFYCYITANAGESNLMLFGVSDSFGLSKEIYEDAKPVLIDLMKKVPIDDSLVYAYFLKQEEEEKQAEINKKEWLENSYVCVFNERHGTNEKCNCFLDDLPF